MIRQAAIAAGDGAPLNEVSARAGQFLASEVVVELKPGLWTTHEILELERRSIDAAIAPDAEAPVASRAAVAAAAQRRPTLGNDQAELLSRIATSSALVDVVVGKAGTGKTFALDALRDAYESDGNRVLGIALAARAARELQTGAGINSTTADSLLASIESGRTRLDASTVIVVDEAAMLPTRQLAAVIAEADTAKAKVVLVGDTKQLPEIEAGGLFAAIARRVEPVRLIENRRQTNPVEREALDYLRAGRVDDALEALHRVGRITVASNTDLLRETLVDDWQAARDSGGSPAMVAATRSDIADLNHRARQRLLADGTLGPVALEHGSIDYRLGDRVLTHENRYDLGLINGYHGTVAGADRRGLLVDLDEGRRAHIPTEYIDEGHLTHGYALTIHKAQGMTTDEMLVLGDDSIYAEMGYTGLSRGRDANRLYVVASRDELDRLATDPLADVRRSLGVSRAQTAAVDLIDTPGPTP